MARKLDRRNSIKVVMQNSFIKARPSQNMEANAQKLLRMTMAQSKMTDEEFYEYEVSAIELAEMFGVSQQNIYQHIDRWTNQCMGTVLEFRSDINQNYRKYALFSMCEYNDGVLRMKLNPDMTPFMLNIKNRLGFTQYELATILTVKGKYTIRIYEMIMGELRNRQIYGKNQVEVELSIEEIRKQTSTENRYKKIIDLKKNVIDKAVIEIEKIMFCKIETQYIKSGRSTTAVRLNLKSKYFVESADLTLEQQKAIDQAEQFAEAQRKTKVPAKDSVVPEEDDSIPGQMSIDLDFPEYTPKNQELEKKDDIQRFYELIEEMGWEKFGQFLKEIEKEE